MPWFLRQRRFSPDDPEWMDRPGVDPGDLAVDLRNLARLNRFFGGRTATRFAVSRFHPPSPAKVLDCACGGGDLTRYLLFRLPEGSQVIAGDFSMETLSHASSPPTHPNLHFVRLDGRRLPFADGSFDFAVCQLALHHFTEGDAVQLLGELARVSRQGACATDLRRSDWGWLGIAVIVHTWLRHPMTRHDALKSAMRAFDCGEFLQLAQRAGWPSPRHQRLPCFRQAVWFQRT